jgi:ankyrin repeat protein
MRMTRLLKPHFASIACVAALSACAQSPIDFEGMRKAEETFQKRQREELVILMSLETMFTDEKVRELANAAGRGRVKAIEEMVAKGVNVNARGKKDVPPLFWALRQSNLEGFTKLLELGANPNAVFADSSIMHWATQHENLEFLRITLKHGGNPNLVAGISGETPLLETITLAGRDRRDAMRLLLASGAEINARAMSRSRMIPVSGRTPLMKAAGMGRFDIVFELLEIGADYKIKDDYGTDLTYYVSQKINAFIPGSPQEKDFQRVFNWLTERGVVVPPRKYPPQSKQ